MFVGPYEHHSNELPWRESIAEVVVIGEDAFPGNLRQARAILTAPPTHVDEGPTGRPAEFEALRWFPLPPAWLLSRCAE